MVDTAQFEDKGESLECWARDSGSTACWHPAVNIGVPVIIAVLYVGALALMVVFKSKPPPDPIDDDVENGTARDVIPKPTETPVQKLTPDDKVENYSAETKKALRALFVSKDAGNKGWLDIRELEECLQICGFNPKLEDVEFFQAHFDKNGDGKLQIGEILENLHIIRAHTLRRDELMHAFSTFDKNGDGFIRLPEMYSILTYNDFMKPIDARKLISTLVEKFDRNRDGKFNYAEFVELFHSDEFQKKVVNSQGSENILVTVSKSTLS